MDARIKSGHDGCALRRDRSPAFRTDPKFIFKQPLRLQTQLRDLAARFARVLL
jgi:hypothetical protein